MNIESLFSHGVFTWVIIPLLIILARVLDVTLGTMRIIFITRGLKYLAPVVGFFEVIIWLIAIKAIMENLNNPFYYVAYAAGFALGNYIGLFIENILSIGRMILRVITKKEATELIEHLRSKGYGLTTIDANGSQGKVNIILMAIRRSDFKPVVEIIKKFNPKAFYTLEDTRTVSEGVFPARKHSRVTNIFLGPFRFWRKGK